MLFDGVVGDGVGVVVVAGAVGAALHGAEAREKGEKEKEKEKEQPGEEHHHLDGRFFQLTVGEGGTAGGTAGGRKLDVSSRPHSSL